MVQEILQMSRISLAAVSVGRRSLIGACSFRPINSRKGCKKGKDIGIDTKKRRCSVRNRPRRNDLRGDKLRQHAWRRKIVCKEDGELRRSDHVKVEHAWTSDCVQCVCDTAQKKARGVGSTCHACTAGGKRTCRQDVTSQQFVKRPHQPTSRCSP